MNLPQEFELRMQALLGNDYPAFLAGYATPLRRGLRLHSSKLTVTDFLRIFPLPLTPSPFAADCFYLDDEHKAGSDPLHHAGIYYMQEPSAASAVAVLNPQPGERVLDLCAAPGGKSTQIATAIGDSGFLWSNEYVPSRARVLQQNLERWGVRRQVVSNRDTADVCGALEGYFDAVLVDAPCSGEGMFRKEPQALAEWSLDNVRRCAARQAEILDNAARAVRPGGRLVYSTCTFAPEENELTVLDFLQRHSEFTPEPIRVTWGCPGFDGKRLGLDTNIDLTATRRILPQHGGEGHFIALLRKADDALPAPSPAPYPFPKADPHAAAAEELYRDCFTDTPQGVFVTVGEQVRLLPADLPDCRGTGVISAGVAVATLCKNRLEPCHSIFLASKAENCRRRFDLSLGDPLLTAFLHGEEIPCNGENGWTAVTVEGVPVGFGKCAGGRLKNRYPKGLRLL
ncbi:MAG: RsmF rRNA methyltransferase first C-terminal domain-containing protein [Clostridia bacterium]|nr:RsmF rRNA methyltransferase first C-terminal domain-containing protein [Clostridia bacterium]